MSTHAVACPHCHAALRASRPVPENKKVRCPQCGASFTTRVPAAAVPPPVPAPLPTALDTPPPPAGMGAPVFLTGVVILGGMAAAGIYLALPHSVPPPAAEPQQSIVSKEDKPKAEDERLAEERRKIDAERRQLEDEKKALAFARLMRQAEDALAKKQFAEAEKAYREALKLRPDDADARSGLTAAKASALAAEAVQVRDKEDRDKRSTEIARLLEQGKAAMAKKEYAAAVRAFKIAKDLAPDNAEVARSLEDALAAADNDATEKKKLADYQNHLDAGRAALTAQRFDEAVREFQAALKILPDDAAAAVDLKKAQNRLAAGADLARRQDAYTELLRRAEAALDGKRPDQAIPLLKEALKLFPDDKNTQKMLRSAQLDADSAQAEYGRLLALGDAAMTRQRFEEAARLYGQAAQVMPGDETAAARAQAATTAAADRRAALLAYERFMTQAGLDMENQRFPAAIRSFQEALRLVPGDANALQGLADARAGIAAAVRQRARLDALMAKGAVALQQLQYAEAMAFYKEALQLAPSDARAMRALAQAKYGRSMAEGRAALQANRRDDAIRSFEEALLLVPGDPAAMAMLTQARIRRK